MARSLVVGPSLVAALAAAMPADAQIVGRRTHEPVPVSSPFLPDSRLPGPGIWREVAQVRGDIRRARDNGLLTRREAGALDRETRRIGHVAMRYGRDGLSNSERDELRVRVETVRSAIGRR
ncbi:MAG: hypothetical protein ACT4OE_09075 [Sphingosinicella sp.]